MVMFEVWMIANLSCSLAEIMEKKSEYSGPRTLKSLEYSLQVPIAMSKCMPGRILKVLVLTSVGR